MLKKLFAATLFVCCLMAVTAQSKPRLAILPFTGGEDQEGEAIAEQFSYEDRLSSVFDIIQRTSIIRAVQSERDFQNKGWTDPNTIAAIGQQLGAQYVVAGNISTMGNHDVLVISILRINNLQLIAGDIQEFSNVRTIRNREIPNKYPEMAENIVNATRIDSSNLPKLAVVPVVLQDIIDERAADVLAQILAINIVKTGLYAVYPRTASLEQVMLEHANQRPGETARETIVDMGYGTNPDYLLTVVARQLDDENRAFNASVMDLVTGVQPVGRFVQFQNINDGVHAMEDLAKLLTGTAQQQPQQTAAPPPVTTPDQPKVSGTGSPTSYGFMNIALGLGSYLQGDTTGGLLITAGYALSLGLIVYEVAALTYDDAMAGIPGAIGLGLAGATLVYGFVKPYLYDRDSKIASILDRTNIALVSDEQRANSLGIRISYTHSF